MAEVYLTVKKNLRSTGKLMGLLPKNTQKIIVPPIKCQGIKTKLVPYITRSILWEGNGLWIEPFMGSGVVLFNVQPKKAIAADSNKHIIRFYKDIQNDIINETIVKEYFSDMSSKLSFSAQIYYQMRDEFNRTGDSLTFYLLTV
jgi:DNA adenine methylase